MTRPYFFLIDPPVDILSHPQDIREWLSYLKGKRKNFTDKEELKQIDIQIEQAESWLKKAEDIPRAR
jgi:hypothetical protein